jgi:exopolysaccharide production protein ExoZ
VLFAPARLRFGLIIAALFAVAAFGTLHPPAYWLGLNPMLLQFAAGVWLARRLERGRLMSPEAGIVLALLGMGLLAAMGLTGLRSDLWRPLLWGAPAAMIVAGALAVENLPGFTPPRALLALGDASYAIYLCHFITVALVADWIGVWPIWRFVPIAVAVSLGAGLAFHHWIERPLIAAARAAPRLAPGSGRQNAPVRP